MSQNEQEYIYIFDSTRLIIEWCIFEIIKVVLLKKITNYNVYKNQ